MIAAQTNALRLITKELKNLTMKAPQSNSEASSTLKLLTIKLPNFSE